MPRSPRPLVAALLLASLPLLEPVCLPAAAPRVTPLPDGVRAVHDLDRAHRESTATRERVSINGLWRWQPAQDAPAAPPSAGWGWFKVPGCWPGITDYMQKDSQTVWAHPAWRTTRLAEVTTAWYERTIEIPAGWKGRRIGLRLDQLNSWAVAFVDGHRAGEARFPGGEIDLTTLCRPGARHSLALLVTALPLRGVLLSWTDSAAAREVRGRVARRGLCGDAWLVSVPSGARIEDVGIETSVRRSLLSLDVALDGLAPAVQYRLRARVLDGGREVLRIDGEPFGVEQVTDGRISVSRPWRPARLWDLHTPSHTFSLSLRLEEDGGPRLDVAHPVRFGFRELWIEGRDLYLNGTRVFLSAVPLDNAQVGAALATYEAARESLRRLGTFGVNFVYAHNYGCEPGAHLAFEEILRAADDEGVLVALSQPHFSHYDWSAPDADAANGYARHAAHYVGVAGSHPSVVAYSMSHNATGYSEDMNPDLIDGTRDVRDEWSRRNARRARRAEAIVRRLDPSRIVYHHASGNLGAMHTSNFYPNFVPIQELSDWFEHWSTHGVKPFFACEYGAPFSWDWTMYRGWYRGERSFGSARVPWEFCHAEWNVQFLGDRAYRIGEPEKANLRWEARQLRAGKVWHRWDYPHRVGSRDFDDRYEVMARYITANWRAHRTWEVSATSPWEHGHLFRLRDGVDRGRRELPVDWDDIQRPGFSPDYVDGRYERMDLAFDADDWEPTAAARALIRNNRPLLAYIGGKASGFTSQDHNYVPGETVEKQLIVVNNSRETVSCRVEWSMDLPHEVSGRQTIRVPTGQQVRVPVRIRLPDGLAPGAHGLSATASSDGGETQTDRFEVHVLPAPTTPASEEALALYDPVGETGRLLRRLGIGHREVSADADLGGYDLLVVGKGALTVTGPAPGIARVRDGLKVIVFEQRSEVLERRLGLRATEYGLRRVAPRQGDHPVLEGLSGEHLRDWRGESTLLPGRLEYELRPRHGPTVRWCDIPVTRAWRCGLRGAVASVLVEKPPRGDFRPIVDGGWALQYAPLLEYREGRGMVLLCQLDVTGRSEVDPAADRLARNILDYGSRWRPSPRRRVVYAGETDGLRHLRRTGHAPRAVGEGARGEALGADEILVVGPGGGRQLAPRASAVADWLRRGGRVVAVGLDAAEANAFLPLRIRTRMAEHIAAFFPPLAVGSPLAGVAPADVHNRDPREVPLVIGGATTIGGGVLATGPGPGSVVFCQVVPWRFGGSTLPHLEKTFRRSSFLLSRILGNAGAESATPLLERFATPAREEPRERRWAEGLYLDEPEEWDDPYRFFRW